ncbi:MAG: hypothetical protein JNM66_08405 [Bryobacterales bacterium]|nr:hypothetical protein [Bryobacterales bacterium]
MTNGFYPEECDVTGGDCLGCVQRTAESMMALTGNPTAEWAGAVFHRLYSHAACHQMEHSFVWACGMAPVGMELEEVATTAA